MTTRSKRFPREVLFHLLAIATLLSSSMAFGAEERAAAAPQGLADPTPAADPVELPAELQAIQRSLGGPSVNQFPSLRGETGAIRSRLRAGLSERGADRSRGDRDAVRALRDAATQLDSSANRLESLELYAQADSMRQLAQRLRTDARNPSETLHGDASTPAPALWTEPTPMGEPMRATPQPLWNHSMPQLQPSLRPDPSIAPEPRSSPADAGVSAPLEPMPQPENRDDRPKPQPLLDSPQIEPKPDVEVGE